MAQKNSDPSPSAPAAQASELLDKIQTATLLGVTPRTVENLMAAGKLPYLRISRKIVRFDRSEVMAHLRATCAIRARGQR